MKKGSKPIIIILFALLVISVAGNGYLLFSNIELRAQQENTTVLNGLPESYMEELASFLYILPAEDTVVYADSIRGFPAGHTFTSREISIRDYEGVSTYSLEKVSVQASEIESLLVSKGIEFFEYEGKLGIRLTLTCANAADAQQLLEMIATAPQSIKVSLVDEDGWPFAYVVNKYDLSVPTYR